MTKYPHLFAPLEVRGRILKNRIMSAPNMLFQVVDGRPTDQYVGYLEHKAKGGAAIVNLGEVPICDGSTHTPPIKLLDKNLNIFGEMSEAIRSHGALASAELTHGGRNARTWYNDRNLLGPVTEITQYGDVPMLITQMTEKDMDDVAEAYASSAEYCLKAGFDMAHVHAGHSWLFAQFFSPFINTRTDEYGGSFENRMRFPLMCLKRMRERVGNRMLITIRISGSERVEGGFTPEDIAEFLSRAQEYIDLAEITTDGWIYSMPSTYMPWMLNREFIRRIRATGKVRIPMFLLGSIMSAEMAEEIIASGDADGVSLSRALIADPCMPNKVKAGREDEVIPCLRCMRCTDGDNATRFFHCSVNPVTAHETRIGFPEDAGKAKDPKKVLVIGGGPGGVQAALTAAERGHDVTLVERKDRIGGTLLYAEHDDLKPDLQRYVKYLQNTAASGKFRVMLNTEATPELVAELAPDHIIVATGAHQVTPSAIPGIDRAKGVLDVYYHPDLAEGDEIVIIGGGLSGVETAAWLAEQGKHVTVLEAFDCLMGVGTSYKWGVMYAVDKYGVELKEHVTVKEITGDAVVYEEAGEEKSLRADSVFHAVGMKADRELYLRIADSAPFVDIIGDARMPARIGEATAQGYFAALDIGTF